MNNHLKHKKLDDRHSHVEVRAPKETKVRKPSEAEDIIMTTNLCTGEIINYTDLQKLKKREEYIKLSEHRKKLTEEDFDKKVEIGSWRLLSLITNVISLEKILVFLSDQIQNAYDLDTTFENGRSFMIYAVMRGDQILLEKFLVMKPDLVNRPDNLGMTPLHYAVQIEKGKILASSNGMQMERLRLITLLLEHQANVNALDKDFRSPMHWAAIKGANEPYYLLKFKGGDGKLEDRFGMLPCDYFSKEEDYRQAIALEGMGSTSPLSPRKSTNSPMSGKSHSSQSNSRLQIPVKNAIPFCSPAKRLYDHRRTLLRNLGLEAQKRTLEGENYYYDFYGNNLSKKYYHEELLRINSSKSERKSEVNALDTEISVKSESTLPEGYAVESVASQEDSSPSPSLEPPLALPEGYEDIPLVAAKDIIIHGSIGKGSFGEIYCISLAGQPDTRYALKSYNKSQMFTNNLIRFLLVEKKIMGNFDHPFLCKLFYSFQTESKLFLVMEYCEKRDVSKLVRRIDEHQLKILACELILAIKALHQQGFVHRDIKPENVLVGNDGHIRVADFGLCKEKMKPSDLTYTFCGSIAYLPPEVISKTGHNRSIDWYLLGELLYEMIYGTPPFYEGSKDKLFDNILHKKLTFPEEGQLSDLLQDLLAGLLCRDISKRLGSKYGAEEIMHHPYFVGIDWDKVYNKGYTLFEPSHLMSYVLRDKNAPLSQGHAQPGSEVALPYWSFARPACNPKE